MSTAIIDVVFPHDLPCDQVGVYVRPAGDEAAAWSARGVYHGSRITIDGLPSTGRLEFGLAPRVAGIEADEGRWTVVEFDPESLTDLTAPGTVDGFAVGQDAGRLLFRWRPLVVADLSHYELRRGSSWDEALWIADIPAPLTEFVCGWWATGAQTYYLRAVTAGGAKSAASATATITVIADPYEMTQVTNAEAPGWAATKTGCEVSGTVLQPTTYPASYASAAATYTDYTAPWWYPTARYPTYVTSWIDAGAVQDQRVELDLAYTTDDLASSYAAVLAPIDAALDDVTGFALGPGDRRPLTRATYDGYPLDGVRLRVEIDTAQDAGPPTPEGYREWVPGSRYRCRQYRLRLTILNDWPFRRVKLGTLTHKRTLRNLKDEQTATVSGTGGTAVAFTAPFTTAPRVSAVVNGTAAKFATIDTVTATGCNVRVWLHDGVEQSSGSVHVVAAGV